jgi:ketosteroid isomerase-like protein
LRHADVWTQDLGVTDSLSLAGLGLAEDRIQRAVRTNDASALALMLHDDLLATGPDGRIVGKEEDVAGYESGAFRVTSFEELDRRILVVGTTGVTLILAHITGQHAGEAFDVRMRYTRTWAHEGTWRVAAAHLSEAP